MKIIELLNLRNNIHSTEYGIEIASRVKVENGTVTEDIMHILPKYCDMITPVLLDAEIDSWDITMYRGDSILEIWISERTYKDIKYALR